MSTLAFILGKSLVKLGTATDMKTISTCVKLGHFVWPIEVYKKNIEMNNRQVENQVIYVIPLKFMQILGI